jgi:hypothetical protein
MVVRCRRISKLKSAESSIDLGLLIEQIKAVEAERDALFVPTTKAEHAPAVTDDVDRPKRDRTGICRRSIGGPSLTEASPIESKSRPP